MLPMNKYQRQSQKTNLWARRRNKTAELMLDGQLRYLEKRCKEGMKQHLTGTIRLEEDWRKLVHVTTTSCEDLDRSTLTLSENGIRSKNSLPDVMNNQKSELPVSTAAMTSKENLPSDCNKNGSGTRTEAVKPHRFSKQQIFKGDVEVDNTLIPNEDLHVLRPTSLDSSNFGTSNRPKPSTHQINKGLHEESLSTFPASIGRSFSELDFRQKHETTCRFNRDGKLLKSTCKHFPCYTPSTYHALGFRRDDASTWSRSKYKSGIFNTSNSIKDVEGTQLRDKLHNMNLSDKSSSDFLKTSKDVANPELDDSILPYETSTYTLKEQDDVHSRRPLLPKWLSGKQSKKFSFRPVSGPSFGPKPRDPILERVRQGMPHKPSQLLDRQPARMTVAGRMRGLKSLISEMREKQEQSRPVDWAVNYGQRLPMRVLLNPAFPVGVV